MVLIRKVHGWGDHNDIRIRAIGPGCRWLFVSLKGLTRLCHLGFRHQISHTRCMKLLKIFDALNDQGGLCQLVFRCHMSHTTCMKLLIFRDGKTTWRMQPVNADFCMLLRGCGFICICSVWNYLYGFRVEMDHFWVGASSRSSEGVLFI
jgi:hypothetical protein